MKNKLAPLVALWRILQLSWSWCEVVQFVCTIIVCHAVPHGSRGEQTMLTAAAAAHDGL